MHSKAVQQTPASCRKVTMHLAKPAIIWETCITFPHVYILVGRLLIGRVRVGFPCFGLLKEALWGRLSCGDVVNAAVNYALNPKHFLLMPLKCWSNAGKIASQRKVTLNKRWIFFHLLTQFCQYKDNTCWILDKEVNASIALLKYKYSNYSSQQ